MDRKYHLAFIIFSSCMLLLCCSFAGTDAPEHSVYAMSLNQSLQDPWYHEIFDSRDFSNLVVSVQIEDEELYSEENGLLSGPETLQGRDGEHPVRLFVYDADGAPLIVQNAGIRLSGASSRRAVRKSFRIIARKEYDKSNPRFTFDLWGGRQVLDGTEAPIPDYQSFILHSTRLDADSTGIHNSVGYSLAKKAGVDEAAPVTPAAFYLNGVYQGAYFIIPAKNDDALAELYHIQNPADIEVVSVFDEEKIGVQTEPEVLAQYLSFVSFVHNSDMNDPAVISEVERQLDVEQCLQYYAVNLLLANGDWVDNNLRVWRCKDRGLPFQDGKWRFFLFDLDWVGSFPDSVSMTFDQVTHSTEYYNILPCLLKNPDYLELFRQIVARMERDAFHPETIEAVFEEENARIIDEVSYDYQSEAFYSYMRYSFNSEPVPEEEYLTLEDRQYLLNDFKNHMLKAPDIVDECLASFVP